LVVEPSLEAKQLFFPGLECIPRQAVPADVLLDVVVVSSFSLKIALTDHTPSEAEGEPCISVNSTDVAVPQSVTPADGRSSLPEFAFRVPPPRRVIRLLTLVSGEDPGADAQRNAMPIIIRRNVNRTPGIRIEVLFG
jgi:hypothetical protein